MGHGTSDQFKYYLHNGYDTEVYGDSGTWSVRIPDGDGDRDLCICETYYFKKVKKEYKAKEKRDEFSSLFFFAWDATGTDLCLKKNLYLQFNEKNIQV